MAGKETVYIKSDKTNGKTPFADFIVPVILFLGSMLLFLPFHHTSIIPCFAVGLIFMIACELFLSREYSIFIFTGVLFAAAVISFVPFSNGAMTFFNDIVFLVNSRFSTQYMQLEVSAFNVFAEQIFFSVLHGLFAILITELYQKRRFMAIAFVIFVIAEAQFVLRVNTNIWIHVLCGILTVWLFMRGLDSKINDLSLHIPPAIQFAAIIFVVCAVLLSQFGGSKLIDRTEKAVAIKMHNLRYGSDSLPKGNMRLASSMHSSSDKDRLRVNTEGAINEYFLGFVGSEYAPDGVWKKHSSDTLGGEWNGLFKWLSKSGFYTQFQDYQSMSALVPEQNEISVTVENLGADRSYIYTPQMIKSIDGRYRIDDDLSVKARGITGQDRYSFIQLYHTDNPDEILLNHENVQLPNDEYTRISNVYSVFADENYKKIDEETKQIINEVFFNGDYANEDNGIYSIITRIRAVLELRTSYKKTPQSYNGGKEFCDWFLNDAREGNSAYYATAGVMALRAAGYSARYCEGYYIPRGESGTITLTGANAHAWAEVYMENLGWIQAEFTPGFYQSAFKTEQVVEISKDVEGGGGDQNTPYEMSEEYKDNRAKEEERGADIDIAKTAFFALMCLIALAMLIIFSRYFLIHLLRKRNFERDNSERYIYSYIYRVLALGGVKCQRTSPLDGIDTVHEKFPSIRKEEYRRMVAIMQKTVFGEKQLEEHEHRTLCRFRDKAVQELYGKSGFIKRIKLKFIDVI